MSVSYKKLWKLLIDRDMKKKDLCAAAGISHASMAKLGKNENVTVDVLVRICSALDCQIDDIMELFGNLITLWFIILVICFFISLLGGAIQFFSNFDSLVQ